MIRNVLFIVGGLLLLLLIAFLATRYAAPQFNFFRRDEVVRTTTTPTPAPRATPTSVPPLASPPQNRQDTFVDNSIVGNRVFFDKRQVKEISGDGFWVGPSSSNIREIFVSRNNGVVVKPNDTVSLSGTINLQGQRLVLIADEIHIIP